MWENGGPGVWAPDYREQYDLLDPEWRFDAIPQILDGKNIADYFDPDIEEKLRMLEDVIGHGILAGRSLANCRGSLN
jgi:nucleolar GTP-binding protein